MKRVLLATVLVALTLLVATVIAIENNSRLYISRHITSLERQGIENRVRLLSYAVGDREKYEWSGCKIIRELEDAISMICPKDVDPEGIFIAARNYSAGSGNKIPGRIRSMIDSVLKEGMLLPVIGRAAKARDTMNWPK